MKQIKQIIFGVRIQGEKLPVPPPIKERPFNVEQYTIWCKEFNVSLLYDRKIVHI